VTQKCEVSLGNGTEVLDGKVEVVLGSATEVLDGKVEVVLDEFTEVVGGKCVVACSDNRRLEEAQEEGAQEAAPAASIVDGFLERHPDFPVVAQKVAPNHYTFGDRGTVYVTQRGDHIVVRVGGGFKDNFQAKLDSAIRADALRRHQSAFW